MTVHLCSSSSVKENSTFRGAGLAYWYPRLFPELSWGLPETISPEALVFVWNASILSLLDRFDTWYRRFTPTFLEANKWLSCPERLFWLTRYANLIPYLQEDRLTGDALNAIEGQTTITLPPGLLYHKDPVEIHQAIRSFQYQSYTDRGVSIIDPTNFYIEAMPEIGQGTRIHSGSVIEGDTVIAENARIGPNVHLLNARIGHNASILTGSLIYDSEIGAGCHVGPYAHLRAGTTISENAKIGNFVEVKKSIIGRESKAMHLSYLGDATLGEKVNIGAGTITCNYDGINKHPTHIEDNVFVGSGTELIAPVTLGKNSFVAAGSTITESVPPQSLAIARMKQRIIPDWFLKRSKKAKD